MWLDREEVLVDKALHGLAPDSIQFVDLEKGASDLPALPVSKLLLGPQNYWFFKIKTGESLKSLNFLGTF